MPNRALFLTLICLALAFPGVALAQEASTDSTIPATVDATDRLFLSFAEEATLVDRQWWEVQFELQDGNGSDAKILRGVVAFQPWEHVELGGRVGFGDSDTPGMIPDGSGATDLDAWGKYHFGSGQETEFAAGATVTIPTGDDTAGLGLDAFSAGLFGSLRHQAERLVFTGNAGVRFNGDGRQFGFDLDGETSVTLGAGVLVPISDQLTLVGEARFETERFTGLESDTRLLGGVNLRLKRGGIFRAAVALGLTDGAPDGQLIVGYAAMF